MRCSGSGVCRNCAAPTRTEVDFRRLSAKARSGPAPGFGLVPALFQELVMKIRNSLKSLKDRHRDCRVIRRRGRTYVINKTNRRFKARQG